MASISTLVFSFLSIGGCADDPAVEASADEKRLDGFCSRPGKADHPACVDDEPAVAHCATSALTVPEAGALTDTSQVTATFTNLGTEAQECSFYLVVTPLLADGTPLDQTGGSSSLELAPDASTSVVADVFGLTWLDYATVDHFVANACAWPTDGTGAGWSDGCASATF
jgi:hypothetical protein